MTTKPLLSLPNTSSSSQICKDEQKCYWIGAGMIILFGSTLKVYFFQLPKLKNVVGGGGLKWRSGSAYQVIKRLKIDCMWLHMLYPTPCRNGHRM